MESEKNKKVKKYGIRVWKNTMAVTYASMLPIIAHYKLTLDFPSYFSLK